MTEIPYYWKSVDWYRFMVDYPPPPMFEETTGRLSDDELHHRQEERFLARVADAWNIRFYRERWTGAVGTKRILACWGRRHRLSEKRYRGMDKVATFDDLVVVSSHAETISFGGGGNVRKPMAAAVAIAARRYSRRA